MVSVLLIASLIGLLIGFLLYSRRILNSYCPPERKRTTPARRYQDGQDYITTPSGVLLGYQFKSISLDPILGPIIAIQFGWLPVVLWLILGVVFAGWIQDYSVTLLSVRKAGASLGGLAGELFSPAASTLLLISIYIYLVVALSAFTVTLSPLFSRAGVPVAIFLLLGTGLLAGQMIYRWRLSLLVVTPIALLLAGGGILAGSLPWAKSIVASINNVGGSLLNQLWGSGELTGASLLWSAVLLGIAYLGAVLPIWQFTQPVNFTASLITLLTLGAAALGVLVATFTGQIDPGIKIPALVAASQPHLGPLWPVVFVTISSGAISGWHALVASFSTSRLLEREVDALPVTIGASFLETCLSLLAVAFAVTIGVAAGRYAPDQGFQLVAGPASVFVTGLQEFLGVLGFPFGPAAEIGVILLTLMALAVMQLFLRFMRMAGAELSGDRFPLLKNPTLGAIIGLIITIFLIFSGIWQHLWALFGGMNQVIAGVALMLVSVWLARDRKPTWWAFWPSALLITTGVAALLYTAIYRSLYLGIFLAYNQGSGINLGTAITFLAGVSFASFALRLFLAGLQALNRARVITAG
jgi:carbon starvation protein